MLGAAIQLCARCAKANLRRATYVLGILLNGSIMKIKRSNILHDATRRRTRLPVIPLALTVLTVLLLVLIWQRGGEQAQVRVEKTVAADKLGR